MPLMEHVDGFGETAYETDVLEEITRADTASAVAALNIDIDRIRNLFR